MTADLPGDRDSTLNNDVPPAAPIRVTPDELNEAIGLVKAGRRKTDAERDLCDIERRIADAKRELTALEQDIAKAKAGFQDWKQKIEEAERQHATLVRQNVELGDESGRRNAKVRELGEIIQRRNRRVARAWKALRRIVATLAGRRQQLHRLEIQIAQLRQDITEAAGLLVQLQRDITTAGERLSVCRSHIKQRIALLRQLRNEVKQLESSRDQLRPIVDGLNRERRELQPLVEGLRREKAALESAIPGLRHTKARLGEECDTLKAKKRDLKNDIRDLLNDLQVLRPERDGLLALKKWARKTAPELYRRERRCRVIERREAKLRKDDQRLRQASREAATARREARRAWADLALKITELEKTPKWKLARKLDAESLKVSVAHETIASQRREYESLERDMAKLKAEFLKRKGQALAVPHEILEWLESGKGGRLDRPDEVVLVGHGPLLATEFTSFLDWLGITIRRPGSNDSAVMITGSEGWKTTDFDKQFAVRPDETLKIYSQEMFVAALVTGRDPFLAHDNDLLLAFGRSHPALEDLRFGDFRWPNTVCEGPLPTGGPPPFQNQIDVTPLVLLGYHAGRTANLSQQERHRILTKAYEQPDLPRVAPINGMTKADVDVYMNWWGRGHSRKRLWRMAHHIAWLVRTRKRLFGQEDAVIDWWNDLDWLRRTFYGNGGFAWPSTKVPPRPPPKKHVTKRG